MRKLVSLLALVGLLATLAIAAAGPASGSDVRPAATKSVTLYDNYFSPKKLTVKKGTKVYFYWGKKGSGTEVEHNVFAQKGDKLKSKDLTKGKIAHRFQKTSTIYCTIHPTTMKLVVKVTN
jgi:plastocyanin